MLFDKWTALEGSVVGLGADPAATLRAMAEGEPQVETPPAEEPTQPELPTEPVTPETPAEPAPEAEPAEGEPAAEPEEAPAETTPEMERVVEVLESLLSSSNEENAERMDALSDAVVSLEDKVSALGARDGVEAGSQAIEEEPARAEALSATEMLQAFISYHDQLEEKMLERGQRLINVAKGKVT
jgi:outer membrane biosynthesis protein TonB